MDKETALATDRFHYGECRKVVGPRGGVRVYIEEYRRNGRNRTWKTQDRFEIPIKYGMRGYEIITASNVDRFHAEKDCPLNG